MSKGNSEFHNKNYEQSKNHYNSAEKHAPTEEGKNNLAFNRGDADYMAGNYEGAIANYKKALQSGDRDVQKKAFFNLGNTYMKMENNREAVNSFINALKLDPSYDKAKKNLEYLLADKSRTKRTTARAIQTIKRTGTIKRKKRERRTRRTIRTTRTAVTMTGTAGRARKTG